jgi:hypothetical protein
MKPFLMFGVIVRFKINIIQYQKIQTAVRPEESKK